MTTKIDQLTSWLKEHKITEVECMISDLTGIARGKISPTNKFIAETGMRPPERVLMQTVTGEYVEDDIYYELLDPADIDIIIFQTSAGIQKDDPFIFIVDLQWCVPGFARAQPLHVTSQLLGCKGRCRVGMNDDTPRGKPALAQLVHGVGQSALIAPLTEKVHSGWSHLA